jgi:ribosome-associated protein
MNDAPLERIEIRDDAIRLGQLLKLAGLVDDGGAAKALIAAGDVRIDGKVAQGRGTQVRVGSTVELGDRRIEVVGPAGP